MMILITVVNDDINETMFVSIIDDNSDGDNDNDNAHVVINQTRKVKVSWLTIYSLKLLVLSVIDI